MFSVCGKREKGKRKEKKGKIRKRKRKRKKKERKRKKKERKRKRREKREKKNLISLNSSIKIRIVTICHNLKSIIIYFFKE